MAETLNPKVQAWKDKWSKINSDKDSEYKAWEKSDWEANKDSYKALGYNRTEDPNSAWGSKWTFNTPTTGLPKADDTPLSVPDYLKKPEDDPKPDYVVAPWALGDLKSTPKTEPKKPVKTEPELGFWKRAFLGLGLYGDPAVATASGWRQDHTGDIVQDQQNEDPVEQLRNNLATIAGTAQGVTNVAAKAASWGTGQKLLTSNVSGNLNLLPGPMNVLRDKFGNIISSWKQGGTMNKVKYFAGGGAPTQTTQNQMSPEQELKAAAQFLLRVLAGDEKAVTSFKQIQEAAKKGVPEAQRMMSLLQQASKMLKSAKWGSKLAYVKSLKFAKGGKTCPVCEGGEKVKVAKKDVDAKTYQKQSFAKKTELDEHRLATETSSNKNGSYNISHKPSALDSTTIHRNTMSEDMNKKYPKVKSKACGGAAPKAKKRYFGGWL